MNWMQELPIETGYYWFWQSDDPYLYKPYIVYIFWKADSPHGHLKEIGGDGDIQFLPTYGLLKSKCKKENRWWCGPLKYPVLVQKNTKGTIYETTNCV